MITITNGRETLRVTQGAYKDIFEPQGFYEVFSETKYSSSKEQEGSVVSLPEPSPENATEDVSDQETDDSEAEVQSQPAEPEVELSEIPLSEMTDEQLREYAKQLGVSLRGITSRKAVRDKIRAAL